MLSLLNAAPDTGNQGVSALCASAVDGLRRRGLRDIAVADHGRGVRRDTQGGLRFGLSHTRRIWRGDCLRTVAALAPVGGLTSASARVLSRSEAVLDVSGGDSFTDLYGPKRFGAMTLTKQTALASGRPLFLLPQTLGPFRSEDARAKAATILRRARGVWVRDARSETTLQEMLGDDFDPARHRRGPDMAVLLPKRRPAALPAEIVEILDPSHPYPVAGLNVSGLLWQKDAEATTQFGLTASHRNQIEAIARTILQSSPPMKLLLVPHVMRPKGDPESDHEAALALAGRLVKDFPNRVLVLGQDYRAEELKWILSQLDWFAGARMHATIGAFSSGVPTLGLGYSDKAAGVFDECGLDDAVADLRVLDVPALIEATKVSLARRLDTRHTLSRAVPTIRARAEAQMDDIASAIKSARSM